MRGGRPLASPDDQRATSPGTPSATSPPRPASTETCSGSSATRGSAEGFPPEFEVGEATLSLYAPEQIGQPFAASPGSVALRVPDVHAAQRELEDADVAFHGETMDTGVCHMAFFGTRPTRTAACRSAD